MSTEKRGVGTNVEQTKQPHHNVLTYMPKIDHAVPRGYIAGY